MSCVKMEMCPLYPKFTLEANLRFWQKNYCEADFDQCERYKMSMAGNRPPDTMLPNGKELLVTIRKRDLEGNG